MPCGRLLHTASAMRMLLCAPHMLHRAVQAAGRPRCAVQVCRQAGGDVIVLLGGLQAVKITPQTDFSRLKVGQLKELLRDRGISCRDCFEKADFISKLRELAAAQT